MTVLACYSIKGGVGKTAGAVNLAHQAAASGVRTLLCDLDSQGASSFYFRVRAKKSVKPAKLLADEGHLLSGLRGSDYPHLDILPSRLAFRKFDRLLDSMKHSRHRLARLFAGLGGDYELIVLDCPPGISLLAENVFNAARLIAVPVVPTTLSELSLGQLNDFFSGHDLERRKLRPFFSMVEYRKRLHSETILRLRRTHPGFFDAEIPYCADIERMGIHRQPVADYAAYSRGALAYAALWEEVREALGV